MDSTRLSLARVLELGVRLSWREAAAIVYEAMARTGPTKGERPSHVASADCELTRGGDVVLLDEAARARPETVLQLLEDLLPACDSPGGLGAAFESGRAIAFLEDLSLQVTAKRRRVEIAAVALRAIGADADHRRAEAERRRAASDHERAEAERRRAAPDHERPEAERRRADSDRQRVEADRQAAALSLAERDDLADALADFYEPIELPPDLPLDLMPSDRSAWLGVEARVAEVERTSARPTPPHVHDHAPPWTPWTPERVWNREGDMLAAPPPRLAAAAVAVSETSDASEFDQLRAAALRTASSAPRLDLAVALRRTGRAMRLPVLVGAVVATLGAGIWWLWPAPQSARPGPSVLAASTPPVTPPPDAVADLAPAPSAEPAKPAAIQGIPRDRTAVRMSEVAPPTAPAPLRVDSSRRVPGDSPPDAGSVAGAISPPASPAATGIASPGSDVAPAAANGTDSGAPDDALYSWATPEVEPPVLRSPAMANTTPSGPEGIDGPYFEVLVAADGTVETVRIRGRIEPGETFYRHRMLLAAAKLWRFTPARLNGRPVRYVTRVVIELP